MMTRKDYEILASAIEATKPDKRLYNWYLQWNIVVNRITVALATNNPNFNESKFRAACGQIPGETVQSTPDVTDGKW